MKTLRRLVAVGLLLVSYQIGMAQSNSSPDFTSETEKKAWIENNRKAEKATAKKEISAEEKRAVVGEQKAKSLNVVQLREDQKQAPKGALAPEAPGKGKSIGTSPEKVARVNNTHKALPANYKDRNPSQTKPEDQ